MNGVRSEPKDITIPCLKIELPIVNDSYLNNSLQKSFAFLNKILYFFLSSTHLGRKIVTTI